MSDKKFEFTVKEKDDIEAMFDNDCLLSDVFARIESLISSRSASPQQGTEGAEEDSERYITDLCGLILVEKNRKDNGFQNDLYVHIAKLQHFISQSQVEQAVKEKDKQISDLTFFNQEHQSYQNLSEIVIGRQKEQISQLEAALKVQTEHVADLMAASLVRPELKVPSEDEINKHLATISERGRVDTAFGIGWAIRTISELNNINQ